MEQIRRTVRRKRLRSRVSGKPDRPRVSVFRSNRTVTVQLIDDAHQRTLAAVVSKPKAKQTKMAQATTAGAELAKMAAKAGIKRVVFDRGGYKYHGRIKAIADALRQGGLDF